MLLLLLDGHSIGSLQLDEVASDLIALGTLVDCQVLIDLLVKDVDAIGLFDIDSVEALSFIKIADRDLLSIIVIIMVDF